jgi:hypothetical protein
MTLGERFDNGLRGLGKGVLALGKGARVVFDSTMNTHQNLHHHTLIQGKIPRRSIAGHLLTGVANTAIGTKPRPKPTTPQNVIVVWIITALLLVFLALAMFLVLTATFF